MTIQFKITNMSCASCALINKKSLMAVQGVTDVKIDYPSSLATVDYDKNVVGEKKIKETIINNGYGVI